MYSRGTRLGVFNVYKQLYRMIREETIHTTGMYVKLRSQLQKLSKATPPATTAVLHGETAHWARMRFFNSYPVMTDPFTLGSFSCERVNNDSEELPAGVNGATNTQVPRLIEQFTFYPVIPKSRLVQYQEPPVFDEVKYADQARADYFTFRPPLAFDVVPDTLVAGEIVQRGTFEKYHSNHYHHVNEPPNGGTTMMSGQTPS